MGLPAKPKNSNSNEGWGLGLFLVFFPDDNNGDQQHKYLEKRLPSFTRSNSSNSSNHIISKAQSTISICAILVFITLLLFTLSNFDHTINPSLSSSTTRPRRWLSEQSTKLNEAYSSNIPALQGMGILFRRGTRAMSDLIVAHLNEDCKEKDLRVFLRTLHVSGVTARADLVLISANFSSFSWVVQEEIESFSRLIRNISIVKGIDLTQFMKERPVGGEPLWGRKVRSSSNSSAESPMAELNQTTYGSVVGFDVSELDPADSLAGFIENHVPIRLRRWACYPMLLGRVRRNFKHIMLVDAKEVILLGDSLSRVRHKGAESVHLWKNSEKGRSHDKKESKTVTSDAIMGGMRGVRWLSNAMLNEIVRASTQKKAKSVISDGSILSQLINNESLMRSSNMVTSTESAIPNGSSLVSTTNSASSMFLSGLVMVRRDTNKNLDVNHIIHKEICLSVLGSFVYRDCHEKNIV
ncbi:hypothetical protein ACHQM5_018936 [Ranunculus cassubicifolius]